MPDEKIDQKRPAHAESELKKMQQRLVDDTVDDSFPASDPPAWTTTGSKSVAARSDADKDEQGGNEERGRATGGDAGLSQQASRIAGQVYETGQRLAREAQRQMPEAGRYMRQGQRAVARPVETYPLTALALAGAVGFGLAWWIYGTAGGRGSRGVPAYGKRSRYGWRPDRMSAAERQRADAHLARTSRAAGAAGASANSY